MHAEKQIFQGAGSSPRLQYLQDYGVLPLLNILMSLSVLSFVLTFFISAVSVCCMLLHLLCLLTCHNDVIDAGQNNRLFASRTDMDRAFLRLSHMQIGTFYVQICDKNKYIVFSNY